MFADAPPTRDFGLSLCKNAQANSDDVQLVIEAAERTETETLALEARLAGGDAKLEESCA